jgi:hypothetical protein
MILKNVVPQDVMAAIEDYVSNAIAANLPQDKAYCVFSDYTTNITTNFSTGSYVPVSFTLSDIIKSSQFSGNSNVITYTTGDNINVIINVVISGYNVTSVSNIVGFVVYKNGAAIPSSIVTDIILDSGSSVSFMCGVELMRSDTIQIYAKAFGDSFNFELENINISITQVS